jgi:hypothetical protein
MANNKEIIVKTASTTNKPTITDKMAFSTMFQGSLRESIACLVNQVRKRKQKAKV